MTALRNVLVPGTLSLVLALSLLGGCNDDVETPPWLPNYTASEGARSGSGGASSGGSGGTSSAGASAAGASSGGDTSEPAEIGAAAGSAGLDSGGQGGAG